MINTSLFVQVYDIATEAKANVRVENAEYTILASHIENNLDVDDSKDVADTFVTTVKTINKMCCNGIVHVPTKCVAFDVVVKKFEHK